MYITDTVNQRIRKVAFSTVIITTIVGMGSAGYTGDNGPATSATLSYPYGIALDSAGNSFEYVVLHLLGLPPPLPST